VAPGEVVAWASLESSNIGARFDREGIGKRQKKI